MRTSKSALFLFELMIIILVFTFAAAVCTQIFASAYNMSMESRELTMSSMNAQTIAEEFKAGKPDIEPLYFDRDWTATDKAGAYYTIKLEDQNDSSSMRQAYVNVYKDKESSSIFSLHVKEFVG